MRWDGPRYVIGGEATLVPLLLAGLVIRIAAMVGSGHQGDITALARWAERVASTGLGGYYAAGGDANYPAVLYLLWPLGTAFDGTSLLTAVRAISIPFDLILGATLYRAGWSLAGPHAGLLAAALYLLNPGAVLAGAFWGQLDAMGCRRRRGIPHRTGIAPLRDIRGARCVGGTGEAAVRYRRGDPPRGDRLAR